MTPHHTDLDALLEAMLGDEPECDCGRPNGDASHEPGCSWVAYMRGQIGLEHAAPALAQALLRARKALERIHDRQMITFDEYRQKWNDNTLPPLPPAQARTWNLHKDELDARVANEALADTELLEALS